MITALLVADHNGQATHQRWAAADCSELCETADPGWATLQPVRLVSIGLSNKVVAAQLLGLCEGTVKIHLYNIYRKLSIPNRATLAMMCAGQRAQ